ncbi:ABC transporter permease [Bosea sp. F3-2]|uniref:ABC transporter permease n=1 Tax=Bosea sp. F3-2 TaxID=2599640 RepID=UPI0011ED3F91|nr:ABC transporter permease [Bosea sp. F3-2]QEL25216.1 ABC transporter permease [Bosea sp. F3-2]
MTTVPVATPRRAGSGHLRRFLKAPSAIIGLGLLTLLIIGAFFAPQIAPQNPFDLAAIDVLDARMPPGSAASSGELTYLLGTDGQGRDLFSAILYGLRTSLTVGVGSATIAGILGILLGLIAAWSGGVVDALIMRLVDLIMSLPSILVALLMLALLGKGLGNVVLTLVLLEWAYYARTARGQALVERKRDYFEAARGLGLSTTRILLRHVLPNCLPPLLVIAALQVARAITLEATLSFLGLGAPVTQPSLGLLIANGFQFMLSGEYWISFFPGLTLLLAIVAINLVGDRLREVLDPRALK